MKTKHLIALVLALLCGAAFADCDPSTAGGKGSPIKFTQHSSGAVVYAWRCPPSGDVIFLIARPEWAPKMPTSPGAQLDELKRLRVMLSFAADPAYLADFVKTADIVDK